MANITLTGSHGYVGMALMSRLIQAGHVVTPIDSQWFMEDSKFSPQDVRLVTDIGTPDILIHLAAISNDPATSEYPKLSWETGVLATMNLCEMANATGRTRFIYASSVSVYGAGRAGVTEKDALYPLSDYNKTKMAAERVVMSYPMLGAQIIRPATICGVSPRMRLDLTVNMFTMQALTKGVITVHGGEQMRPSIHMDDMIDLYLWMIDHPEQQGIFNAGFENDTVISIAEQVAWSIPGTKIQVTQQSDKRSYMVNSDKIQTAGFKPKKTYLHAVHEVTEGFTSGTIKPEADTVNLLWMKAIGVEDQMPDVAMDSPGGPMKPSKRAAILEDVKV